MRTIKTFLVVFALVLVNATVNADPRSGKAKATVQDAIKSYVDAFANGKVKGLSEMLDSDVSFTTTRGDKTVSHNKFEIIEDLKQSAGIVQNCETNYEVVESLPNQTLVKVTMRYETFTKENLLTLTNSNRGWKISKVSTSFK